MLSPISRPSKAVDFAEEAVVDEPEAADHREADRVGDEVFPLVPERVCQIAARQARRSIPRLSTSSVIAIAKTPSLKATIRENSISFSSRRFARLPAPRRASSRAAATEPRADPS